MPGLGYSIVLLPEQVQSREANMQIKVIVKLLEIMCGHTLIKRCIPHVETILKTLILQQDRNLNVLYCPIAYIFIVTSSISDEEAIGIDDLDLMYAIVNTLLLRLL